MAQENQDGNAVRVGVAESPAGSGAGAVRRVEGLAKLWSWLTTSRYTRALEAEVTRLRVDNGALMRALLGAGRAVQSPPTRVVPPGADGKVDGTVSNAKPVPAARRRSWQQIGRMLELEVSRMLAQKHGGVGVRPAQQAFSESNRASSEANGGLTSESSPITGKQN